MIIRCFQNGSEPYYTEFLNGFYEMKTHKKFLRRWPVEWSRYTTEPRDNNLYSISMMHPVEHCNVNMDDLLGNDLDLRLWAAEPPVLYDSQLGPALKRSGRLTRRARIPVEVPANKSLRDLIKIAETIAPVDPGPSYQAMEASVDEATAPKIGRGISPRDLKTAKLTSEVEQTIKEAEAGRMRIIEIPFQRLGEDLAELSELLPYDELIERIGPDLGKIVFQRGSDITTFPGGARFELNAPRRKQSNLTRRTELRDFAKQWGDLIQQLTKGAGLIELAYADAKLTDVLTAEQIDRIIPPQLRTQQQQVQAEVDGGEQNIGNARQAEGLQTDTRNRAQEQAIERAQ